MIEVKNLVKVYGINKAVDNLNFNVEKGQIVGFLGPNGAGKSTTMNIITGYISATEGTVIVNGYDILKQPEEAKANIGYLPEQPPVYMDMTVKEYLTFAAQIKGVKRREVPAQLAMAMEARCYRGGIGRTKMKPLVYARRDYIAYGVVLIYVLLWIAMKMWL